MASLESITYPGVIAEVDPTFRALRVSQRPLEYQSYTATSIVNTYGHYRVFGQTAAIAPTASAIMGNFRFAPAAANSLAVILRAYTCVTVATAVTAQRTDPLLLKIARSYTANETTQLTTLTVSGNNGKMRTNMGTCQATVGVTGNTAGQSGGTSTVDSNAIGSAAFQTAIIAVGSGMPIVDLYKWDQVGQHPLVLVPNEGLQLFWGGTTLATGTVTVGWGVEWAEVPSF